MNFGLADCVLFALLGDDARWVYTRGVSFDRATTRSSWAQLDVFWPMVVVASLVYVLHTNNTRPFRNKLIDVIHTHKHARIFAHLGQLQNPKKLIGNSLKSILLCVCVWCAMCARNMWARAHSYTKQLYLWKYDVTLCGWAMCVSCVSSASCTRHQSWRPWLVPETRPWRRQSPRRRVCACVCVCACLCPMVELCIDWWMYSGRQARVCRDQFNSARCAWIVQFKLCPRGRRMYMRFGAPRMDNIADSQPPSQVPEWIL